MGTVEIAANQLKQIGLKFPFPKPLPLIEYLMSFGPLDGVYLDFFAGSGTTGHAVMNLNSKDSGSRRFVLITNNEVGNQAADDLRKSGLRPGDEAWDRLGVFEDVTKPRIEHAAEDHSSRGSGANVEFFTLTYESALQVASGRAFARIAPLLWMRAGSTGRRIESVDSGWDVADTYGVLVNLDRIDEFVAAVAESNTVTHAFVFTDEVVSQQLPDHVEPVRMYDAYMRNAELEAPAVTR